MADALVLGTSSERVRVRPSSPAPYKDPRSLSSRRGAGVLFLDKDYLGCAARRVILVIILPIYKG